MAKIVLMGLESGAAEQISQALATDRHEIESRPGNAVFQDSLKADIIFAGGEPHQYLGLLRRVREARPEMPFVIVTRIPGTREWLDALEAGATDYCSAPYETRQLRWLLESALPKPKAITAAA
jgi:DNA-binding NtrC family response regulator